MSETVIVSFRIEDGIIAEVREYGPVRMAPTYLTSRRDIRDAVARVANAPVGGKEET